MTTRGKSLLRQLVPSRVRRSIKRSGLYIRHRSAAVNIYHCCVHKTGSQWVKAILSDSRTFKYSGLTVYGYQKSLPGRHDPRKITDRSFTEPLPKNAVISPLYIDFQNYTAIPKPKPSKAFFVMRDPRDIVVSWYFSSKYSHSLMGKLHRIREVLNNLSITDGILYSIEHLHDFGLFRA